MELKANQKKALSDVLFILWAGGAALLSYSLVYALRKPFMGHRTKRFFQWSGKMGERF